MDFMFEDDVDEVGSDVEAYCPKCKGDTTHVVISKYEDEIRRVQCNPCGDVHSFRKPRGEAEEDMPEPVAARKRAMLKKATFEEFFAKHSDKNAKSYEFRETYKENNIVVHPKFGKGFISEVVSDSKVEVTFADARRILVHNRKDIPGSPVGAEDDGLPSTATVVTKPAKKDGSKAKAAKAAPSPAPATPAVSAEAKVEPAAKAEKKPEKVEKKPEKVEKKPEKVEKKAEKKPEKKPEKVEKKAEKKPEKKPAPAKKAEKKPEKKPAPAKKVEKKPEKKAEKKPAPAKKVEKKPEKKAEKKPAPAKKAEKKPEKKPAKKR